MEDWNNNTDIVKAEDDPQTQEELDELNEYNDMGSESW